MFRCNFCGRYQHEVAYLIAGPEVYICDECVELCNEILAEVEIERRKIEHQQKLYEATHWIFKL